MDPLTLVINCDEMFQVIFFPPKIESKNHHCVDSHKIIGNLCLVQSGLDIFYSHFQVFSCEVLQMNMQIF